MSISLRMCMDGEKKKTRKKTPRHAKKLRWKFVFLIINWCGGIHATHCSSNSNSKATTDDDSLMRFFISASIFMVRWQTGKVSLPLPTESLLSWRPQRGQNSRNYKIFLCVWYIYTSFIYTHKRFTHVFLYNIYACDFVNFHAKQS